MPGSAIRTGVIYQCGTVEAAAKVTHILDICSSRERKRHLSEVEGVTSTWFNGTVLNGQPILAEVVEAGGAPGIHKKHLKILDKHQPTTRVILKQVHDKPGKHFLFHRTGK
ncbi:hypothetical protein LZ31DRAFT_600381 [Colletotrichum somersetense]|nr:hypothetical protein LZ31DRAFT_600381 [Colletotrichum somersetense]